MTPAEFKARIKALKWSQAKFARKSGISAKSVSAWVTGKTETIPTWVDAYLALAESVDKTHELVRNDHRSARSRSSADSGTR